MNCACGQLQFHERSLQNTIMHSKHLDSFTEDTVIMVGDRVSCRYDCQYANVKYKNVKSSYRQRIGTAVNMKDGRGRLQVCHNSSRDSTEINCEGGGSAKGRDFYICTTHP